MREGAALSYLREMHMARPRPGRDVGSDKQPSDLNRRDRRRVISGRAYVGHVYKRGACVHTVDTFNRERIEECHLESLIF